MPLLKKHAKIHTIREDKNNRWTVGCKIDFFINVRQPKMFRFAPVLPVLHIQKVNIVRVFFLQTSTLFIDNIKVATVNYGHDNIKIVSVKSEPNFNLMEFIQNDGFDTVKEFFAYFNKNFTGKLIHWTDKQY
ncbi:hypothetical protein [Flavobacterium sp.]|uniref:hypothetical protein n=1 Tax=Flavobacterium sp. TaxID=239 RepID=UPI0025EE9BEB|nr:hypothetical protein [Flavobacterium sp.]